MIAQIQTPVPDISFQYVPRFVIFVGNCGYRCPDYLGDSYVGAFQVTRGLLQRKRFAHQTGPEKSSRADIWCARLQMAWCFCFVSTGILGLRRFGGRTK